MKKLQLIRPWRLRTVRQKLDLNMYGMRMDGYDTIAAIRPGTGIAPDIQIHVKTVGHTPETGSYGWNKAPRAGEIKPSLNLKRGAWTIDMPM